MVGHHRARSPQGPSFCYDPQPDEPQGRAADPDRDPGGDRPGAMAKGPLHGADQEGGRKPGAEQQEERRTPQGRPREPKRSRRGKNEVLTVPPGEAHSGGTA